MLIPLSPQDYPQSYPSLLWIIKCATMNHVLVGKSYV
jgi:hypothetical protein